MLFGSQDDLTAKCLMKAVDNVNTFRFDNHQNVRVHICYEFSGRRTHDAR